MDKITVEDIVMNLVCNGGDCRSKAMEALYEARLGNYDSADELMKMAEASMHAAHEFHTKLLQADMRASEEGKETTPLSLIIVHGQDHLMNAMVVYDLATEMIEMYKLFRPGNESA